MNTKHYLVISGIVGGVVGSLLTTLLVSKLMIGTARFDTIQCHRLEVFGNTLKPVVVMSGDLMEALRYDLGNRSGGLSADAHKPGVFIGMHDYGGIVSLYRTEMGELTMKSATLAVKLNAGSPGSRGGYVGVRGNDGESWARLGIDENGGRVGVSDTEGDSTVEIGTGYGNDRAYRAKMLLGLGSYKSNDMSGLKEGYVVTMDEFGKTKALD